MGRRTTALYVPSCASQKLLLHALTSELYSRCEMRALPRAKGASALPSYSGSVTPLPIR